MRPRMLSTTRSRTSAVFPPASRCRRVTIATCSTSGFVHAPAHDHQRIVDRYAELLVLQDAPELGLEGLVRALEHHVHRADEAVAGAKCPGENVEVVRELLAERLPLLLDAALDDVARHEGDDQAGEQAPQGLEGDRDDERRDDRPDDRPARRFPPVEYLKPPSSTSRSNDCHQRCPSTRRWAPAASMAVTSARRMRPSSSVGTLTYCDMRCLSERLRASTPAKSASARRAITETTMKTARYGRDDHGVDPGAVERASRT